MKYSATIILTILTLHSIIGQKTIEEDIPYTNQLINIDLKHAKTIEIKTWDKPLIYYKADIMIEKGKHLDKYKLKTERKPEIINIISITEPIFAEFQEEYDRKHPNSKKVIRNTDCIYSFDYVIHVPNNSKVHISSYTGNLISEYINGNLTTNLSIGNILINKYEGELNLTTNGGNIEVKVVDSKFTAETINGQIYANEKIKYSTVDSLIIGQKIEGNSNKVLNKLYLKTFNGNIFLK